MKVQPAFGKVVGGDCIDGDAHRIRAVTIGDLLTFRLQIGGQHVVDGRVHNHLGGTTRDACQNLRAVVIAVLMGDKDQVRRGEIGVILDRADRVDIDRARRRFHHEARMADREHIDLTGLGLKRIRVAHGMARKGKNGDGAQRGAGFQKVASGGHIHLLAGSVWPLNNT